METVITIKKNKPAFKALILLARELEKTDHLAISIKEKAKNHEKFELIVPVKEGFDQTSYFNKLADFPTLDELRKVAWIEIGR